MISEITGTVFHTSLSEEILFRGFILKRISNKFGFIIGNLIQSILFGLLHGVIFITYVGILKAIWIGYSMGYINEKKANVVGGYILLATYF